MRHALLTLAGMAMIGAGCAPHLRPLRPVMENGEVIHTASDETVERARVEGELERERLAEQRGSALATAMTGCVPAVCEAVARGELALGMNEAQVLAATRTTPHAWDVRRSGRVLVMSALPAAGTAPSDAQAEIAFVALHGDRVVNYTYREAQGLRTVSSPEDATAQGRARARAAALLRQGDDYTAAGNLALALERYDQADILNPGDPETTLRIARVLDKQLRPVEAILRYRMFIHQMELERIRAEGEVAAGIAEAIARAHERIVVLERR